ncbi:MAG: hypothetical protein A2Y28_02955 [Chlamydiae bacterium GWC2_50_10]|nr:MAG: hypothetical protein A2Z85_02685 [Chlamydiae bacterium GWA2_50_15]OGN54206.1 MAG: hypothetical protein A2Y28_02955 [Chlamydiae bacterium GWC2_50_10]OGN58174.1 MAG: hypothetical protein A3D18_06035 [Chlamydiae bacterium RIFCSPHIGHO2_02_FULL_49_29]OGN62421.1 MAG: hypothetical protein A3E26_05215 [Chlamydiae bacterium RIFCSPHIGHO2_12_FULL_49_32]OGN67943.1 MAG: hypothetical protein A3I15_06300 [Chlamydiae bacterium RIFCSPLOWO2_02_FULL_49_12]OGN74667.1 MAG: hypothetical protein A3G30_00915 
MVKIFITRRLPPVAKTLLSAHFQVEESQKEGSLDPHELLEAVQKYDALLCTLADVFTRDLLDKTSRLSALSNYAIGLDNIDLEAAKKRGVAVYNLPDVVTHSTADLTFALILSFIRKVPEARVFVQEGKWEGWSPDLFLGEELFGKCFGIMGFGKTGRAVAKRALGFGLKVKIYHYRPLDFTEEEKRVYTQVSFDELLEEADYLSLHLPLKEGTRFLIDRRAFERMKRRPLLINMARGAVVHTDDLVLALKKKEVRGALLDVVYPEPISHRHPLTQFENCVIVPHIGSATVECRHRMAKVAAENLIRHFCIPGALPT